MVNEDVVIMPNPKYEMLKMRSDGFEPYLTY